MKQKTAPVLEGWIVAAGQKTATVARYATRYSIWVDIANTPVDGEIENLQLVVADAIIDIGPCRLVPELNNNHISRRLIATDRIHDFEQLFFESKEATLELSALNLEMTLNYKHHIDKRFKDYVADLTYDLNVYNNLLDTFDTEGRNEPPQVWAFIQQRIIDDIGTTLLDYLEERYQELIRIVSPFTEQEHEHHGFYFRKQLWNILLLAPLMARSNLKPRGYNGDSEMMRMVYHNDYEGESTFGKILHKYSVGHPAAQAVRNRREVISGIIKDFIQRDTVPATEKVRLLSVACGPAFELGDIFQTTADCQRLHVSLLDQDQAALLEAGGMIEKIQAGLGADISVDFIKESVRTMMLYQELKDRWGQFHFIYSMGLFDYLTDPVATAVINKLYQLLHPQGVMIIGNMFAQNYSQYLMEYWHDWKIILRTEEEVLHLCDELPDAKLSVRYDATGIQMLLQIVKGGT